jgi:hypothetical protein
MLGWIRSAFGGTQPGKPVATAPSAVQFSEYKVRAFFKRRSSTHIDNWYPAAHPDEAVAAARKRFPTADQFEYLGDRRDLTAAEIEALRRGSGAQ